MSTGSGTSLGDSGTHSDPEDRKFNEVVIENVFVVKKTLHFCKYPLGL